MKRRRIEDAATAEFHCTIKAAVMTRAAQGHGAHGAWPLLGVSVGLGTEQGAGQGRWPGGRKTERKKERNGTEKWASVHERIHGKNSNYQNLNLDLETRFELR